MIQTRTRSRQLLRILDEKLARTDRLSTTKGLAAGAILSAMLWGLLAIWIA